MRTDAEMKVADYRLNPSDMIFMFAYILNLSRHQLTVGPDWGFFDDSGKS
jgi:hypothetical protein